MKTIFLVVVSTVVFICSMIFVENKRTESVNKINLEYQQALQDINSQQNIDLLQSEKESDEDAVKEQEETPKTVKISITGEVEKPGTYELEVGTYLMDLLAEAGGEKETADHDAYNSYYTLDKNMDIYIAKQNNGNKISINTADIETLDMLPGIGTILASRIVDYREQYGQFNCINDLTEVEGLGESAFNKIKDFVRL